MLLIGLTGGIGCGKSTVANLFVRRGAALIDTDKISRALTAQPDSPAMPAIRETFGTGVLDENGALNRAAMRQQVFSDPQRKRQLESILHPLIRDGVATEIARLAGQSYPYMLLDVPLLFDGMSYRTQIAESLVVDCPVGLQIARVGKRAGMSDAEAQRIVEAQIARPLRLQLADRLIFNAGTLADLEYPVAALHDAYATRGVDMTHALARR
jgi:dephospho-CoA kinase